MSFHLYIMRHAKSDWSASSTSDFNRPINSRGQKNAKRIGQWMVDNDFLPEKIISSPAVRARQTAELLIQQLNNASLGTVQFDKDLYLASEGALIECIQLYKSGLNSLMLIAHNPGMEQLVNDLLNTNAGMISMTTANLAIIEFPKIDFDPELDKGELIELIKPKELN